MTHMVKVRAGRSWPFSSEGEPMHIVGPGCNIWCNERGHYLLPSGPQGEPFSHQRDVPDR